MTPMTCPLAVNGTASAGGFAVAPLPHRVRPCRCELDTAGPVGDGGRRVGVERDVVRADQARFGRRLEDLAGPHAEPLQPAFARDLHHAGVGQPAHDKVHRALDHRGRVQAGAQQPRDVGEQGQALPGRLGVAQGLALLLEELGPFERLSRQPGQCREKPQLGLARLGAAHEGEGENPERPHAPHERFGHDRDRLSQLRHDGGHDLGRHVGVDGAPTPPSWW